MGRLKIGEINAKNIKNDPLVTKLEAENVEEALIELSESAEENTVNITQNTSNIAENTIDIAENTIDIAENKTNIDANTQDIETLNSTLADVQKVSVRVMTGGTLDINVAAYGNLRIIRASAYTKRAMTSGTTYTINQVVENFVYSVNRRYTLSANVDFALSIANDGMIQITPTGAIPVDTAINFYEVMILAP